jgi:hypothetical protein
MEINNLINKYQIKQIDNSYPFNNKLENFTDYKKNTLFFGCKNKNKRTNILRCKNEVIIVWTKYDFKKNKLYKNRIFLEKIKDSNNIKHYFIKNNKYVKLDITNEDVKKNFINIILNNKLKLATDNKSTIDIDNKSTIDTDNNSTIDTDNKVSKIFSKQKNIIYTKITGGFGNQLLMVFNIISLSKDYNKEFYINFDKNYKDTYFKNYKVLRKNSDEYIIFNNIEFNLLDDEDIQNLIKYKESKFKYTKIELEDNNDYFINGYFQSYKYFLHNKRYIKRYLNINFRKLNKIYKKINIDNKKIISIHIRLGDYTKKENYHSICSKEYYLSALNRYKLDNYTIILFSDDMNSAKERLKDLNINFIEANKFFEDDEYQFYMLCLSNIRICANSTFSLMSCYINEMYNFVKNAEYILPKQWFGKTGPDYDIYDIIPKENKKFILL